MKRVLSAIVLSMCAALPCAAQRSTPLQLLQPSGAASDQFGSAVTIDGDTMIVGAPNDDVGANADQGSAHVYRWTGSGWAFEATLIAADGAAADGFGNSIAISGDTAIVSAWYDDVGPNSNQGSAYIFVRTPGTTTWTQQAKLTASGGAAGDRFGSSVALSGDTAVVGALYDSVGANTAQGSAYVFTRSGTTWTQQAQLTASGGASGDYFGTSVALSGDTALVGAYQDDVGANADQGSAYVFTRSGTTWTQQAQLAATDGAANDYFGSSVALSGDTAVVVSLYDDIGANTNQGSAYVFTRSGTTWTQQAQLTASDGAAGDIFGYSVALSGDTAVVGSLYDDVGANTNQGSAYVFTRSGTTWTQQAQLTASDGAAFDVFGSSVALSGDTAVAGAYLDDVGANGDQGSAWVFSRIGTAWIGPDLQVFASAGAANDYFGYSVAISGDTAVVGAYLDDVGANVDQGSAYVFTRSGSAWTQQAQLIASAGAAGDNFGGSVALSGDTAIVGAYLDDVGANANQGSAYVFTRLGSAWTQQAQLAASDGAANDYFGYSVALSGDTAVVGAFWDDVGANTNQGSAYVFTRSGTIWTQQAQLTASDGAAFDIFGSSVALSGDTAVAGAYLDDVGANGDQGSAYVFTRSGTIWTQQARLTATDGAANDCFSSSVALSGDTAVVGAYFDDVGANPNQGSVYVFTRLGSAWTQQAQLTASGGAAGDNIGYSVALSGDTAVVGAPYDDVGAHANQGSFHSFDIPFNDFAFAHNDATDVSYPTLAAAMLPAQSGQQITATTGAWRGVGSLNTFGRSLGLLSSGDLRTTSTSILDLGGSSILAAAPGSVMDIFGQLRVASGASGDVYADAFTLGSRGIMTTRTGSSLTINAPLARLEGQTRLEQGASLTLSGGVTALGPTTANLNASLTTGGTFTNIDTFTITSGTISSPLFDNRAQANIFGTSAVFGSYSNNAGATTIIRSGTLFVFGSLTNNGTIVGTICSGCLSAPPSLDVSGDLAIGVDSSLTMPFLDSLVHVGGDFDCAVNSNTRYDMSVATLQFEGFGGEQTLEVMSTDIGPNVAGLDRTIAGHFPIGTLHIGSANTTVRLVDDRDNDGLGQGSCEAIYVDTLRIDAGSRLINPECRIYYNTLVNEGTVDVPENLVQLAGACLADFNMDGFVDFTDFDAFVTAFEAGDPAADFNQDGFIDFTDFDSFVSAFEAGC